MLQCSDVNQSLETSPSLLFFLWLGATRAVRLRLSSGRCLYTIVLFEDVVRLLATSELLSYMKLALRWLATSNGLPTKFTTVRMPTV